MNASRTYKMIFVYLIVQILWLLLKSIFNFDESILLNSVSYLFIQILVSLYIFYNVKKYYSWDKIGFSKLRIDSLVWIIPYCYIIVTMLYTFFREIYINIHDYDITLFIIVLITFVGTFCAGFCEEVLFRGIILNHLKKTTSLIQAMLISSVGFSIFHLTTVFTGNSLVAAVFNVILASLLGFAFAALALKLNNLWPLIMYHSLWNFILISSNLLNIELSKSVYYNNFLNIIISIVLWGLILNENKKRSKYIFISNY